MLGAVRRRLRPSLLVCLIVLCDAVTLWLSCCYRCCYVSPCSGAGVSTENRACCGVGEGDELGQHET
jgi:hypothetical protein